MFAVQHRPMPAGRVLVVDDEPIVRDVLARYLRRDGFEVETASNGEDGLAAAESGRPDLVVLDLMLPRLDGFEVFRRLRDAGSTSAVIMLTARGEVTDRIVGLESGADDYVAKPFSPREVVVRVQNVLGRGRRRSVGSRAGSLRIGAIEIDPQARAVRVSGAEVRLTPKEFDLLCLLAASPRTAFSRYQLLEQLWDVAFDCDPATVTVHVRRIREKIEADPSAPRHLVTVWGVGYRFEP